MDLYCLRHAIAVQRGARGYGVDRERPLTANGERKMRRIAAGMQALGLSYDCILSSPYLRAKQTADIVAEVFKAPSRVYVSPTLAPDGNPRQLLEELHRRHGGRQNILLVGHEPYLSNLISRLVSGGPNLPLVMKKGGLCKLRVGLLQDGRCATLEWLLTPRQLQRLS